MFSKHYTYNDVDKKQGKATSYSKIPYIKNLHLIATNRLLSSKKLSPSKFS